jgi:hypothetical protein
MVCIEADEERRRLEQVYSQMTEAELRSIAGDGSSLTSEAIKALSAEISRRGLDVAVSNRRTETKRASQTEFTTRHGLIMLGIFAGMGLALILLVLSFPQWFRGCIRVKPLW